MSSPTVTPQTPVTPDQYIPMDAKISMLAKLLSGFGNGGNFSVGNQGASPQAQPTAPATVTPTRPAQAPQAQVAPQPAPVKSVTPSPVAGMQSMVQSPAVPQNTQQTMAVPDPKGLVEPGNLPIWNRPTVQNADGSHSSEYSVSYQDKDGREVLVPTVVGGKFLTPDGKKPQEGSPEEKTMFKAAWQNYQQTGQHLGKFDNPGNADAYAEALHNRGSAPGSTKPTPVFGPQQPTTPAAGMEAAALGPSYTYKIDDPRAAQAHQQFLDQPPGVNGNLPAAPNSGLPAAPAALDLSPQEAQAASIEARLKGRAPSPNDPENKPKWYDRLFGAMATFGAAYQHNPNAMQLGQEIMGRRYNNAMTDWQHQHDSAQTELEGVNREIAQKTRDYGLQRQNWNDQIELGREGRANTSADALNQERIAKAGQKDYQSMTPTDRAAEVPNIEKALGSPLSPDDRKAFIVNGKLPTGGKRAPGESIQANLFSDDPKVRAEANRLFLIEHPGDSGPTAPQAKPMTPTQKQSILTAKDKALKAAQTQFNNDLQSANGNKKLSDDERAKHVSAAKENYLDAWQQAQNDFETATGSQQHLDIRSNVDPNTLQFKGGAQPKSNTPPPVAQSSSAPKPPKQGDVVKGYKFLGGDPAQQKNWKKA